MTRRRARKSTQLSDNHSNNTAPAENSDHELSDLDSFVPGGPLTDKETNACLIATVTYNPYGQPYKLKGKAWQAVTDTVNKDAKRQLSTDTIKRKVNTCIKLVCALSSPVEMFCSLCTRLACW